MKSMDVHRMPMRTVTVLLVLLAVHANAISSGKDKPAQSAATLTNDSYRPFLINNIFNYYGNNGDGSYNKFSLSNEGLEFPKGSDKHIIFEDGLLWGGMHKGRTTPKVGGSVYRHALQAGPLLTTGTPTTDPVPADPSDPGYRIYRVRPDIRPDIPFASVERSLSDEEVPYIARYEPATARGLFDQYIADWNEWPAALGAPFTDVDKNGVYDPAVDIPGRPGADQTLWYVANDMDPARTYSLAGCPPIGLEVHRTIWGYRRNGALGNTVFVSTVLINKSGVRVDSMYIAQWADPDLGNGGDDLVGCDTALALEYVYNGRTPDPTYGVAVPAAGFAFIQGPMVPGTPADTAAFLGSRRPGYRNLGITAFVYYTDGLREFVDPRQQEGGDVEWYRQMRGLGATTDAPYIDPITGRSTAICVPGDPVRSTDGGAGWVDGTGGSMLRDRRLCMSSGPFSLAHGDTQHVVIAASVAQGTDRIASIAALRSDLRTVKMQFGRATTGRSMPHVSCSVTRDSAEASLVFRLDAHTDPLTAAAIRLTTIADAGVATIELGDDGLHDDVAAGDGIWGGTTRTPARSSGMKADAHLTSSDGEVTIWENVLDHITTARLTMESFGVASDNINSDGIANPGENIRYLFALRNESPFDLRELNTRPDPLAVRGGYTIPVMPAHAAFRPHYDPNDAASYFFVDIPAGFTDSTIHVAIVSTDDSLNVWRDTLDFPVRPLPGKVQRALVQHVAGKAGGDYAIQVVDPARVKDHLYVLRGVDSADTAGSYTLKDSTTAVVLIAAHPFPDVLGHTSPVVDGFKVLRGTIDVNPGMASWDVPSGTLRFSPVGGFSGVGLEGFTTTGDPTAYEPASGTIGAAMHFRFGSIRTRLGAADHHTVLLRLAAADDANLWDPKAIPADTNFSRAYRYLRGSMSTAAQPSFAPWIINQATGYPYQGYDHGVPFSAWDMDVDPPVRLAVGHLENNAPGGRVDGRYWPGDTTADNFQMREFAFIFRSPYTETPDPALTVNLPDNPTTPLMWVMTCNRASDEAWVHGDEFLIAAHHFPTAQDAWVFNPSVVAGVQQAEQPLSFALLQNYPNPFNPSTTIRYDLPAQSEVTITVYDILGRAVRHLVREVQPAGSHAVLWRADNDAGSSVASGVYLYRCTVERSDRGGQFDQTMKMILLR